MASLMSLRTACRLSLVGFGVAALARPLQTSVAVAAVSLLALLASPAAYTQAASGAPSPAAPAGGQPAGQIVFGSPLSCPAAPLGQADAVLSSMNQVGAKPTRLNIAQARAAMATSGNAVSAPTQPEATAARATQVSWLILGGHVVAAKMLNDASADLPGYSAFGDAVEAHLTAVTQPVQSNDNLAAELGATKEAPAPGDLMAASASLNEVIQRASTARVAMGALYREPAVRFYLLSQGFRDAVGALASRHGVCALKLSPGEVDKLNVSSRYMAMPSARPAR